MSLADMFRANNMPVEQQVARIQAPQMPAVDMSQFFSMMPRQVQAAPAPVAPAPLYPFDPKDQGSMNDRQFRQTLQRMRDPAAFDRLLVGMGGEAMATQQPQHQPPAQMPTMQTAQTTQFPSQAQMAARSINQQAAGRLGGGK